MCDDLLGRQVPYSIVSIYSVSRGSYSLRENGTLRSRNGPRDRLGCSSGKYFGAIAEFPQVTYYLRLGVGRVTCSSG